MPHSQRRRDGVRRRASEPCDGTRRSFPCVRDRHSGLLPLCDEEHHAVAPAVISVPRASTAAHVHQGGRIRASSPGAGVRTDGGAPRGIRHSKRRPHTRRTLGASFRSPKLSPRGHSGATRETHSSQLDGRGLMDISSLLGDVGAGSMRNDPRGGQGLKAGAVPLLFYPRDAGKPATREKIQTASSARRPPKGTWDRESIRTERRNRETGLRPTVLATAPGRSEAGAPPEKPAIEETWVTCSEEARQLGQLATGDNPSPACPAGLPPCVDGGWAEEIRMKDEQIRVLKQQLAALGEHPMEEVVTLDVGILCCRCWCPCLDMEIAAASVEQ